MAHKPLTLTYYSDILCIWAYISQPRIDEVTARFAGQVAIDYRFCPIFGDTAHKIRTGWADRGGYAGYASYLRKTAAEFDYVKLHPEIWQRNQPASSMPAHLVMKAVQRVDKQQCRNLLCALRTSFFTECRDIGRWSVLKNTLAAVEIPVDDVQEVIHSGQAYADLEADRRNQQIQQVQGSPTIILNKGRQKLYGNLGFGVIEANINELLRSPVAGAASWC